MQPAPVLLQWSKLWGAQSNNSKSFKGDTITLVEDEDINVYLPQENVMGKLQQLPEKVSGMKCNRSIKTKL